MCRKMCFLMSVVLLLGVVGNAAYSGVSALDMSISFILLAPEELDPSPLIGHWKLDDNLETNTVVDNGVTGIQQGILYDGHTGEPQIDWVSIEGDACDHSVAGFEGIPNTAFYFDGIDDKVYVPAFNREFSTMTITAWIKRDGDATSDVGLVYSRRDPNAFGLWFGPEQVLRYEWHGHWQWFSGKLFIPDNQWVFVAMVVEPTKATLYVNETSAVNAADHVTITNNAKICFGEDDIRDRRWYRGCIDDVRIYDCPLSEAELRGLMGQRQSYDPVQSPAPAEILYNLAKRYEQSGQYERVKGIYQQIIEQYPDSPYADMAQSNISRMVISVFPLIELGQDSEAQAAIDELTADFFGDSSLPSAFYYIAKRYEQSDKYEEAESIYQQIIQGYPESSSAYKAQLDIPRLNILSLIDSGDDPNAMAAIDSLIADFNDHSELPEAAFLIGEQYYYKAFEDPDKCRKVKSEEYLGKAKAVWERIIAQCPQSPSIDLKHAYYFSAVCYRRLGQYERAIEYYQKVVDDWPDYNYAWSAQYLIGQCYEKLLDSGSLSESQANPKIEWAYQAVVEKYPDCAPVKQAALKLGRLNFERDQWVEAARYFELFLQKYPENQRPHRILYPLGRAYDKIGESDLATEVYREFIKIGDPRDPRIKRVKARLEELEGINK